MYFAFSFTMLFFFTHFFYLSKLFSFKHQPRWYPHKRPAKRDRKSLIFYQFTSLKSQIKKYIQLYNPYRLHSDVLLEETKIRNDSVASPILSDVSSGYPASNSKLLFDTGNRSRLKKRYSLKGFSRQIC